MHTGHSYTDAALYCGAAVAKWKEMSAIETKEFGAAALATCRVSDEECNRWRLLSLEPSSLNVHNERLMMLPYIMMEKSGLEGKRSLVKRSTRTRGRRSAAWRGRGAAIDIQFTRL